MGLTISLASWQEERLKACLANDYGSYGSLTNNCASPVQDCLKELGIDTENQTLPVNLGNKLLDLGVTTGTTHHPATSPESGTSAPWAR